MTTTRTMLISAAAIPGDDGRPGAEKTPSARFTELAAIFPAQDLRARRRGRWTHTSSTKEAHYQLLRLPRSRRSRARSPSPIGETAASAYVSATMHEGPK